VLLLTASSGDLPERAYVMQGFREGLSLTHNVLVASPVKILCRLLKALMERACAMQGFRESEGLLLAPTTLLLTASSGDLLELA